MDNHLATHSVVHDQQHQHHFHSKQHDITSVQSQVHPDPPNENLHFNRSSCDSYAHASQLHFSSAMVEKEVSEIPDEKKRAINDIYVKNYRLLSLFFRFPFPLHNL